MTLTYQLQADTLMLLLMSAYGANGVRDMDESKVNREDLLALASSCIPVAVYQFVNKRVLTVLVSDGFCNLLGFCSHAEAVAAMDANMYEYTHPDDVARIANAAYQFATQDGTYEVAYRSRDIASGKGYRTIHARGEHVYDQNNVCYAVVWYMDEGPCSAGAFQGAGCAGAFGNEALREQHVQRSSYYDALTGLPSTGYFFELADMRKSSGAHGGKGLAFMYANLTGMRFFNRKHGYARGDELIRAVARILAARFGNDNCGYLGQGCFAFVVQSKGVNDALHHVFNDCRELNDGRSLPLRVGVYVDEEAEMEASAALDKARVACDACPHARISTYRIFSDAMIKAEDDRQYIIDNLDRALSEGWVQVYYQPIVRASNGRVCDEEALARWIDPVRGFLSPGEFIPVLEEARLIYKLDLYVLDQVLQKMRLFNEKGLFIVPSSINLSRSDFEMCDMVDEVRRRVDKAEVAREMITIEITESTIGNDFDYMREQVRRFQKHGFSVWMDDFGSEYSSLDNLQRIPFNLIKLDMGFMREFNKNEKSHIILTELVRMAIDLGVDTVAEGVETQEQVDFLRQIGCSKLQGFYFSKPNSQEEILRRYENGTAIGFENPDESSYFSALGRINLYDLSSVARDDRESYGRYFDSLPMAVIESDDEGCAITRCNSAYRDFLTKIAGVDAVGKRMNYASEGSKLGAGYLHALRKCAREGGLVVVDELLGNGMAIHGLVRRVAQNHVTGTVAMVEAVLSVTDESGPNAGVTFAHMARALSADYINLYYVNLDTDSFIEYRCDASVGELEVMRSGNDFFGADKDEALTHMHEEDREVFAESFTKQKVVDAINEQGTFSITYRIMKEGVPTYANMKAMRVVEGTNYVMFGVNIVDAQMKWRETRERMRAERATYERITALIGGYICIYTVDPVTNHYLEYSATDDYAGLGIAKEGLDFFEESRENIRKIISEDELDTFLLLFTKQGMLEAIERDGIFKLRYRILINNKLTDVNLRAAMVREKDGPRVIVGVLKVT